MITFGHRHLLSTYLRPFWRRLLLLFALLASSIALQLGAPQIVRRFLDAAQSGTPLASLTRIAGLFLGVVVVQKVMVLLTTAISEDLGWATTNRLRSDLTEHCLRLDMSFHKLRTPGELIERVDGDVGNLAEYFSQLVVQVLGNGLLAIGIVLLLLREDWRAGLIGLSYALLVLIFLQAMQDRVVLVWSQIRQSFAELYGFVEERIAGLEDVRANGGEAYVMSRLYPLMSHLIRLRVRGTLLGSFTFSIGYLIYVLGLLAILVLGATGYQAGQMTIGTVFLLVYYVQLLDTPLKHIRRQIANVQQALASIGRIGEFFQIRTRLPERAEMTLPNSAPTVTFDQVSFSYRDREADPAGPDQAAPTTVLDNISFELQAGRVLGLLGRSGSGKTTLTRLLFRLYDVDAGSIRLDGMDIRAASLSDLRRHIGLVTQDVELFAASVRDNLTLFRRDAGATGHITDQAIMAALESLGLWEWYQTLPAGLDTILTGEGFGLSAGEAQLLAFTRVFLRDPRIVVLDEASSRLDPASEMRLEQAIDRLVQGRTTLIIAHRLRTVQCADDILILGNGRVLEFGPRRHLSQDPRSHFYRLLQTGMEELLA